MNPYEILPKILDTEQIPLYGWTLLQQPLSLALYSDWLEQKHQGTMEYLKRHEVTKAMQTANKLARSAIVVGIPYIPHPQAWSNDPIPQLRKAAYSKGEDYHHWLQKKLDAIIEKLQLHFPDESFRAWVDSGPVLERDLAYRSGLGWIGKNTCLINKNKGSFFLIGEIYTSLHIENKSPLSADFCGTCTRCINACPTGAIQPHRILEATKCISYWTIECKDIPEINLRKNFQDWIFGCDICQDVCPWNSSVSKAILGNINVSTTTNTGKVIDSDRRRDSETKTKLIEAELKWVLVSSNKEIQKALTNSALSRASGYKLKRNALIVIANLKICNLKTEVKYFLDDDRLSELAKWCLEQLD